MSYLVRIGGRQWHALRGNLHVHTTDSDGCLSHRELAEMAEQAGLDFVVVTDHNVFRPGLDRWMGRTLLLEGEEVHDPQREPQSSHTLCFGIREDVAQHGADPARLNEVVAEQGGFTFLAHPFEHDAARFLPEPNISWRDWQVSGYAGIELWNYMSEFKALLRNRAQALVYAYRPEMAIRGPYPETLRKWDELLRCRRVSVLGGSDAHGTVYHLGPLAKPVQPYDYLFRCINTHLLVEKPLTGELDTDKAAIYHALRNGRAFVSYEQAGAVAGFTFWAHSGHAEATMGESLSMHGGLELRLTTPGPALLRIVRDGQIVAQARGHALALMTRRAGVYRAEAYRRLAGRLRGWIFSNPIYVS